MNKEIDFEAMSNEYIQFVPFNPRLLIITFPKSGTHLANLIAAHILKPQKPIHWIGNFKENSWTTISHPPRRAVRVIKGQPRGTYMMGHLGYDKQYEDALEKMNTCVLFVYRDLRDVAVSQAYHIEAADEKVKFHPGKELFMELPTHEDRIKAVIEGLDIYSGLFERWELYAPWLDVPWVLPIKYEEMRNTPHDVAEKVIGYMIKRENAGSNDMLKMMLSDNIAEAIEKSTELQQTTKYSSSYRKGKVGGWEEEFTPEILKIFNKKSNGWLERLGYN